MGQQFPVAQKPSATEQILEKLKAHDPEDPRVIRTKDLLGRLQALKHRRDSLREASGTTAPPRANGEATATANGDAATTRNSR